MTRDRQQQQHVVVLLRAGEGDAEERLGAGEREPADAERIDQVDPLRPVGEVDRRIQVVEEDPDDLAEAERDDRQVVAAQLQGRSAEQHAEQAGDPRADRQDHPERQVDPELRRGQQRVGIRADGVESDVAQVEEPGEADDDVEPERKHRVDHREVENADPCLAGQRGDEGQHGQRDRDQSDAGPDLQRYSGATCVVHARSATRSPSRPDGRKIRTRISTKNANTSW